MRHSAKPQAARAYPAKFSSSVQAISPILSADSPSPQGGVRVTSQPNAAGRLQMGRLRALLLVAGGLLAMSSTGCFVNQYPGDRNERLDVLMVQSENLRQIYGEWRRFWMND